VGRSLREAGYGAGRATAHGRLKKERHMALENWISTGEMHAIATIVNTMSESKMYLGELGGDVLRIPIAKLKKAGYKFLGCDIDENASNMEKLRGSFQKLNMSPEDTDESLTLLAEALAKVLAEVCVAPKVEVTPQPTKRKR